MAWTFYGTDSVTGRKNTQTMSEKAAGLKFDGD
jgi:hypothetical protein